MPKTNNDAPSFSDGAWHQATGWPEKEGMQEGGKEFSLQLKNGNHANVRHALAERSNLERMLRSNPQHFSVLLALCQAHTAEESGVSPVPAPESMEFLKTDGTLESDGTVRPIVRDVLLSSYQITPDGPTLTMPFVFSNPEEPLAVDRIEQQIRQRFKNWLRERPSDDDLAR